LHEAKIAGSPFSIAILRCIISPRTVVNRAWSDTRALKTAFSTFATCRRVRNMVAFTRKSDVARTDNLGSRSGNRGSWGRHRGCVRSASSAAKTIPVLVAKGVRCLSGLVSRAAFLHRLCTRWHGCSKNNYVRMCLRLKSRTGNLISHHKRRPLRDEFSKKTFGTCLTSARSINVSTSLYLSWGG
jgi:hypothetical protein